VLALTHRLSQDHEIPLPGPPANVGEAQEVERLRLAFITLAPILFRKTAKFDNPCLIGMQLEAEVPESLAQLAPGTALLPIAAGIRWMSLFCRVPF
jgi:hypothetical protein